MTAELNTLKVAYFQALPKRQLESFCKKLSFNPRKAKVYDQLAKARGAVTLSLGHEAYTVDELKVTAQAISADDSPETEGQDLPSHWGL